MKLSTKTQQLTLTLILLFSLTTLLKAQTFDGYVLYNEQNNSTTYLIDKDGDIAHRWNCNTSCNYAVFLKEDGNLVRGGVYSGNRLEGAAIGGIIQEYAPNGDVVWEFVYSSDTAVQHHDITVMPNGNVLFIAWEVKTTAELTQAGYNNASDEKWPTQIIEIEPDGKGSAQIVWEWHLWDHLIQDIDNTKDNFGVIADHPELMDINAIQSTGGRPRPGRGGDWFHCNGIDYNEDLDQIVVTSRYASELFIIDHSTTTAEAASHSGGNSGMGGDLIYRWGNPGNYDHSGTQIFTAAVHDPNWIKDGRPYAGHIQVFNNSGGGTRSSAIDLIKAPVDGYNYSYTKATQYAPATYTKRYITEDYADGQSASDRMTNGNIFVNLSREYMYEADSNGNVIWQYNASPAKAFRYECAYDGIKALLGDNACETPTNISLIKESMFDIYPNPSSGIITINNTTGSNIKSIEIYNSIGLRTSLENSTQLNLSHFNDGVYFVNVTLENGKNFTQRIVIQK